MAKYCEKCGNKINEGAKYCDGCGAQVGFNEEHPSHPKFVKRDMVMAVVLSFLTCGIYGIYWNYTIGKKMYEAGRKYGKSIDDNSIIYLLLSIFGLSLVNYCLIQNDLNKFAD